LAVLIENQAFPEKQGPGAKANRHNQVLDALVPYIASNRSFHNETEHDFGRANSPRSESFNERP
jgi:hypothetical protein